MKKKWTSGICLMVCLGLALMGNGAGLAQSTPDEARIYPEEIPQETQAPQTAAPDIMDAQTPQPQPTEEPMTQFQEAASTQSAAPAQTLAPQNTKEPIEAYLVCDGMRYEGTLQELMSTYKEKKYEKATVTICTKEVIVLDHLMPSDVEKIDFVPDRTLFPKDEDIVIVSAFSPAGIALEKTLYVWVGKAKDAPSGDAQMHDYALAHEEDVLEMEVIAQVQVHEGTPRVSLYSVPEISGAQRFAASRNGGDYAAFEGSEFIPDVSGQWRFAVLDAGGSVLARSQKMDIEVPKTEINAQPGTATQGEAVMTALEQLPLEGVPEGQAQEVLLSERTVALAVTPPSWYAEGIVSEKIPHFVLSGIAEEEEAYVYAVSEDGGMTWTPLAQAGYTVTTAGRYAVQFAILDARDGCVIAVSEENYHGVQRAAEGESAQAYMQVNAQRVEGTFEALLSGVGQEAMIYIMTQDMIVYHGTLSDLSGVRVLPDPERFGEEYEVVISAVESAGEKARSAEWISLTVQPRTAAVIDESTQIAVIAKNYLAGTWTNTAPTFALSYTPLTSADAITYALGVTRSAQTTMVLLQSNTWTAQEDGEYAVYFNLVQEGTVAGHAGAKSAVYDIKVDKTPPQMLITKDGLKMTVYMLDATSGVDAISLDGGATWTTIRRDTDEDGNAMENIGVIKVATYTSPAPTAFAQGKILVRDVAGNFATNDAEISLTAASGTDGAAQEGGGQNAGVGGTVTTTTSHAANTETTITAYDGVSLVVPQEAMDVLVMGGEVLDVSLTLQTTQERDSAPDAGQFTATLAVWNGTVEGETPDTLILTAENAIEDPQSAVFTWTFNGVVYKKLAASGIDYLVLRVGEQVTAISTAGFTAGIRYSLLKSAGIASKAFEYSLTMQEGQTIDMTVTVESERYAMRDDMQGELYYYNIYTGTMNMLNAPFGAMGL